MNYYNKIKERLVNNEIYEKIKRVVKTIKQFFRKLLQIGSGYIKDYAETEVKQYYDNKALKC